MTNVITYIIIVSFITFVNTFQVKKWRKTSFYSNQKINILYSEFINVLIPFSCLNLWFEQTSDSEVYKTYYN